MRSRTSGGSRTVGRGDTGSDSGARCTRGAVAPDVIDVRQRPAGGRRGRRVDGRQAHTSTADDGPTSSLRREASLGSALEDSARDVNRPCDRQGDTRTHGCGAATTFAPNETEQYYNNQ